MNYKNRKKPWQDRRPYKRGRVMLLEFGFWKVKQLVKDVANLMETHREFVAWQSLW
jgi:hypothetical protein